MEGDFDGVADLSPREPPEQISLEKSTVHAKADLAAGHAEAGELSPQFSQKGHRAPAVIHVPRAISHPQHVRGLSQVRRDRVVAGDLTPMRVVAALGSLHLQAGRDHHSVDIDRDRPQLQPRQDLRDHGGIERHQMLHAFHSEALEPAAHRARRGPHPRVRIRCAAGPVDRQQTGPEAAAEAGSPARPKADVRGAAALLLCRSRPR